MKLKLVRGCICGSLTADDIEEIHMTDKEKREVKFAIRLGIG